MIKVITDSSADISQREAKEMGITVVPLAINFGDGVLRDGVDIMPDEFYKRLVDGNEYPTTSMAVPKDYEQLFLNAENNGDVLIVMPISRKLSGSYDNILALKNRMNCDNVYVVDTLATVSVLKLMVKECVRLKDEMPIDELLVRLEGLRRRIHLYASLDTLAYLVKGGRIGRTAAALGTVLSLKPVVTITDGEVKVAARSVGVRKSINFLADKYMSADIDDDYPVIFGYTYNDERMKKLVGKVIKGDSAQKYYIDAETVVSPTVGVHVGPNVAVVTYVEKSK